MKTCNHCQEQKPLTDYYLYAPNAKGIRNPMKQCKACVQSKATASRKANPQRSKDNARRTYLRRKDKCNAESRAYHEKNREKHNAQMREYYRENKTKEKQRVREWRDNNPGKVWEHGHNARIRKERRTPIWAQQEKIKLVYHKAQVWSKRLGVKMTVDHVLPMNGNDVSGLHCWENLQIMSSELNREKHNGVLAPTINLIGM